MKKYFLLVFLTFLAACGGGGDFESSSSDVGMELYVKESASSTEVTRAQKICMAFRKKRISIVSGQTYSDFYVTLSSSDCNGKKTTKSTSFNVTTSLATVVKGNYKLLHSDIETDLEGVLSDICDTALNDNSATLVAKSGRDVVQFAFDKEKSFTIYEATLKSSGNYEVTSKEVFDVTLDQNSSKYGFVSGYTITKSCASGSAFSSSVDSQSF